MQSEQKKEFLLTGAYYAVLAAALYLFLRYLLWWLLPFLLAFAAARAMEPVILFLRRTVHFKRAFSAALLTLFLLFFQLFLICCSLLFKAFPLLFSIVCNFVSCSIIFLQCLRMCSCSGICSINDSFPPFCNRGITISFAVSFQILIFNLVRQFFNKNISKLFSRLSNIF